MCFSPAVSFSAAALLIPAGAVSARTAFRFAPSYIGLAVLPMLLGVQQMMEGFVWLAGRSGSSDLLYLYSVAYLFFAWLVWPIWIPLSVYLLEQGWRQTICVLLAIGGGALGALQYAPYFVHEGWLQTTLLPFAIRYGGTEFMDLLTGRWVSYGLYVTFLLLPLFVSSDRRVQAFGLLLTCVLVVTYVFFSYAYISVFCFGGAIVSIYLLWLMKRMRRLSPLSTP